MQISNAFGHFTTSPKKEENNLNETKGRQRQRRIMFSIPFVVAPIAGHLIIISLSFHHVVLVVMVVMMVLIGLLFVLVPC